jgi:hypothetical protein
LASGLLSWHVNKLNWIIISIIIIWLQIGFYPVTVLIQ